MTYAQPTDFGKVAASYNSLTFLAVSARELVRWAAPQEGERWLDVATGTGEAARALAAEVGVTGAVIATDLSEAMLQVAQSYHAPAQLSYVQADGLHLPIPSDSQDGVLCAAGLFFMPDMVAALREWRRVLRPGGRVAFSSFAGPLMAPLPTLWAARLAPLGLVPPSPPIRRLNSLETAQALLLEAGFSDLSLERRDIPLHLTSPEERWAHIVAGLEGLPLRDLPPATVEKLRSEHLVELAPHFAEGSGTFFIPLIMASGKKP